MSNGWVIGIFSCILIGKYLCLQAALVPGAHCAWAGEEQVQREEGDQQQAPGGGLQEDTAAGPRLHGLYTWRHPEHRSPASLGPVAIDIHNQGFQPLS